MSNQIRVPTQVERRTLLDILKYVIIDVRSHAMEMTSEQVSHLMDAVHNIPYYLETYEEHYWDTIFWDLNHFDERQYEPLLCGRLMKLYDELKSRHEEDSILNTQPTDHG